MHQELCNVIVRHVQVPFGDVDRRDGSGFVHFRRIRGRPSCTDTENYYTGPEFPPGLATRIHPLASGVSVEFEHGELRTVSVTLNGKFNESDVLKAFDLTGDRERPPTIMSVSVQNCSLAGTWLLLSGFDHLDAGDVDCSNRPRR